MAHAAMGNGEARVLIDTDSGPFEIDPGRTAVIVVDMQNDFGSVGGMFERSGIDISMIQRAVAPTARVLDGARRSGIPIVYLAMAYRPDLSDAGAPDSPNWLKHLGLGGIGAVVRAPDGTDGRILIRETWNTAIIDELAPEAEDVVLYKTRFSGFYETGLHETLQDRGIRNLIFTGCTTSVCVESTVRDAFFRDYSCLLLADCMGEPIGHGLPRSNHEASLLVLGMLFGWVSDSARFGAAIGMQRAAIRS